MRGDVLTDYEQKKLNGKTPQEYFSSVCEKYLTDLKYRGVSAMTERNYRNRLALFILFWVNRHNGNPSDLPQIDDIEAWRNSLVDNGTKNSTVVQYLHELRYFYNAVTDEELEDARPLEKNIVAKRLIPKAEHDKPYDTLLPDELVSKLWDVNNVTERSGSRWLRNYAIVVMLLSTKIRNKELLDLTLSDLDFENEEIIIRAGKGNKTRYVDFPAIAQSAVKLYLHSGIRPSNISDDAPLFGTTAEHRYGGVSNGVEEWHRGTTQWLSALVEKHVKKITGVADIRTHDLRHIGARLDLNGRHISMEELQSELGHSSVNTTQIYSGRLMTRHNRKSAQDVFAARDRCNEYNQKLLAKYSTPVL